MTKLVSIRVSQPEHKCSRRNDASIRAFSRSITRSDDLDKGVGPKSTESQNENTKGRYSTSNLVVNQLILHTRHDCYRWGGFTFYAFF